MNPGFAVIMGGLLGEEIFSHGITRVLFDNLVKVPRLTVRVGSYRASAQFALEAKAQPAGTLFFGIGHSLGASEMPDWARMVGRPVELIYGFDPADNLAANVSPYALTPVPANVRVAKAVYREGFGLGGGKYERELADQATEIENWTSTLSHEVIEEAVARHDAIEEFIRRSLEA